MPPQTLGVKARGSRAFGSGLALFVALALASGPAWAQATAPALQPAPPLEAGDTAAPPGAPVEPTPPAPALTPLAPVAVEAPLVAPLPPAPRREPVYQKQWFWGVVGVLVITGAIILSVELAKGDPSTPNTRLGDMRAF